MMGWCCFTGDTCGYKHPFMGKDRIDSDGAKISGLILVSNLFGPYPNWHAERGMGI